MSLTVVILALANGHILFGYERIEASTWPGYAFDDCNIRKDNHFYRDLFRFYDSYVESICFVLIPFVLMSFCSLLIIMQIFETRKTIRYNTRGKFYYYTFSTSESIRQTVRKTLQEEGRTRLRDKDIQLCSMLIGTTLAFLLLCLPTEINDIFNYTGHNRSCVDWFRKVLLMLMQQIYYAGHFYIYTLTGQLFRKHLHAILFPRPDPQTGHRAAPRPKRQFLPLHILSTLGHRFQPSRTDSNSTLPNGHSPLSCTTSFVNTTTHRPNTTIHELTQIQSNDTYSNDPSQRLLSDSKYILGTY